MDSGVSRIRPYENHDAPAVIDLWQRCDLIVPWNDPQLDIDRKLGTQPDSVLVATVDGQIVGTVMVGYDGHRGWINYLATAPEHRRRGVGRALMKAAEERMRAIGCLKINLQIRRWNSNAVAFYERIGYAVEDVVSMGRRLE